MYLSFNPFQLKSMKTLRILLVLNFIYLTSFSQNILSLVDSIQISGANIWGGISHEGDTINVTTMSGGHINLVKFDTSLNQIGSFIPLTFSSDIPVGQNIADHKHLYINNHIYVSYCTGNAQDLYLIQVDINGNRIGSQVAVVQGGTATNDMILVSDSTYIYVFWGPSGLEHYAKKYDFSLNLISTDTISLSSPLPQLGTMFYKDNIFYHFAGEETQNSLCVYRWNTDWTMGNPFKDTIIYSVNNEWNYFATGAAYDQTNHYWYLGYHHFFSYDLPDHDAIFMAVFDDNFTLLENQQISDKQYFRPHFLLLSGYLYVIHDGSGVYLKKYKINNLSSTDNSLNKSINIKLNCYPNPSQENIIISFNLTQDQKIELELLDSMGKKINSIENKKYSKGEHNLKLKTSHLPTGIYILSLKGKEASSKKAFVVTH